MSACSCRTEGEGLCLEVLREQEGGGTFTFAVALVAATSIPPTTARWTTPDALCTALCGVAEESHSGELNAFGLLPVPDAPDGWRTFWVSCRESVLRYAF